MIKQILIRAPFKIINVILGFFVIKFIYEALFMGITEAWISLVILSLICFVVDKLEKWLVHKVDMLVINADPVKQRYYYEAENGEKYNFDPQTGEPLDNNNGGNNV